MEELKPDYIKNKILEEKEQNSENKTVEAQSKTIEDKNLERKNSEQDPNIIDQKKELEQIKFSHIKQYSFFELIIQSLFLSMSNKQLIYFIHPLFNIIRKSISQYLEIKIPVQFGKILNTIIKEKDYNKLCHEFKIHIFFLSMRVIINYIFEIFGFFFVKNSLYENKKIVINNIAEKDIEFFDLYRTGEIVDGIKKNEKLLDNNFISKPLNLL